MLLYGPDRHNWRFSVRLHLTYDFLYTIFLNYMVNCTDQAIQA